MIVLKPAEILSFSTSAAGAVDWRVSWNQLAAAAYETADGAAGNVATATTTNCLTVAAAKQCQVKHGVWCNVGTVAQAIVITAGPVGAQRRLFAASIAVGESIHYTDTAGFAVADAVGRVRIAGANDAGKSGNAFSFYKIGTAAEAIGSWYSWAKDVGTPGAWVPGTPGFNGRATDGTLAADAGCLPIRNATTGANYLTQWHGATSVACHASLFDVLWVNSGLVVTTTTGQTIAPAALPARDLDGTTNGAGCWLGLLVTTATTNAAAINNITCSYTNSAGVAGRTATMAGYPATAVIGTIVWFQLAAGDTGVRSVQSVTFATSLVAGAVSLFIARPLWSFPSLVANVGGMNLPPQNPGVRLYNGTCALPFSLASATTANTLTGFASVMER